MNLLKKYAAELLVAAVLCPLLAPLVARATVETVSYISDLTTTLPASGDSVSEGAQHIRNIKTALKNTFPNITGAVNPTQTELNYVVGVTSAIQTQITAKPNTTDLGLHFIASTTLSNTATTVDFTSGIDSTYDEYELHVINAVPVTTNNVAVLLTSPDAGGTWSGTASDYDWVLGVSQSTTSAVTNGGGSAQQINLSDNTIKSTTANGGFSAIIRIFDPASATVYKKIQWAGDASVAVGNIGAMETFTGAAQRGATAAVTGIRFKFSSGNIAAGAKFKLYGVRKS